MPTIIGISGALRRGSLNAALLRATLELAPAGLTIEVASIQEFPSADGRLVDEAIRGSVAKYLGGFSEFTARVGHAR